jgi:hypothetical protein
MPQILSNLIKLVNLVVLEKALDAYNDLKGQFVKGEFYVAALSLDGTLMVELPTKVINAANQASPNLALLGKPQPTEKRGNVVSECPNR